MGVIMIVSPAARRRNGYGYMINRLLAICELSDATGQDMEHSANL
jgi:hypothetical protein